MSEERAKEIKKELEGNGVVAFADLVKWMTEMFGEPRINRTSHRVFKMPWPLDPRVNLQPDGKDAKRYQVRQCLRATEKLLEKLAAEEAAKNQGKTK